jgi:hypothetical protein
MSEEFKPQPDSAEASLYQIRIKGHLGGQWAAWFGGMSVSLEDNGETVLTGFVLDQAALHGLLKKVRDLGLHLVALNRLKNDGEKP